MHGSVMVAGFLVMLGWSLLTGGEECCLEMKTHIGLNWFMVNRQTTSTELRGIKIKPCASEKNSVQCFVPTKSLFNNMSNTAMIIHFVVSCEFERTVTLMDDYNTRHPNVISYFETLNCQFSSLSLSLIGGLTRLTVLSFYGLATVTDNMNCSYLEHVGSLSVVNQKYPPNSIDFLYLCQPELSFMAEVRLINISLEHVPSNLSTIMPNLQYLDLSMNNLTTPPVFPWNDNSRLLPMNLSRTTHFQNQYLYSFGNILDIPRNEYQRGLVLDLNTNLNLETFDFQGTLQVVLLNGTGIRRLHNSLFSNVTGLQYLSLQGNFLYMIPSDIFISLEGLIVLDLSHNKIQSLPQKLLRNLKYLVRLNLSNNKLTHIEAELFAGLSILQEIYLENNNLINVNEAFSLVNNDLRKIILTNNPIVTFPVKLLYLHKLQEIVLQEHNMTVLDISNFFTDKSLYIELRLSLGSNPQGKSRTVDMSYGALSKVNLSLNTSDGNLDKIKFLFDHFRLILDHNPLLCNCHIASLVSFVKSLEARYHTITTMYPFKHWKCIQPSDLYGRMMLLLNINETYCRIHIPNCPTRCTCYKRTETNITIVNCRDANLTSLPQVLPLGKLELWFTGNMIQEFVLPKSYCESITELDIQDNYLRTLDSDCVGHMKYLEVLLINNNYLQSLPKEIKRLHSIRTLQFGNNDYRCDCRSLWLKRWIADHKHIIIDLDNIKCSSTIDETDNNIENVPDSDFICKDENRMIIIMSLVGCVIFICLILAMILYINWQKLKIFLYVHTGAHPFDKRQEENVCYDIFIVYSASCNEWVQNNVINPLENDYNYKLFTVCRNFRFGHRCNDNISDGILKSKRLLVVLSSDLNGNSLIQNSIEEGIKKCKESKANFFISILHNIEIKDIDARFIKDFMKRRTLISTKQPDFLRKLAYFLPRKDHSQQRDAKEVMKEEKIEEPERPQTDHALTKTIENYVDNESRNIQETNISLENIIVEEPQDRGRFVFVWYADEDFDFMMRDIVHPFEEHGHRFILADKSFLPGTSIQENIMHAINKSQRTIFILSEDSILDEWLLYAFRFACERHMTDSTFMMGLLVRGDVRTFPVDEEISHHLLNYTSLRETDVHFTDKLKDFLAYWQ